MDEIFRAAKRLILFASDLKNEEDLLRKAFQDFSEKIDVAVKGTIKYETINVKVSLLSEMLFSSSKPTSDESIYEAIFSIVDGMIHIIRLLYSFSVRYTETHKRHKGRSRATNSVCFAF